MTWDVAKISMSRGCQDSSKGQCKMAFNEDSMTRIIKANIYHCKVSQRELQWAGPWIMGLLQAWLSLWWGLAFFWHGLHQYLMVLISHISQRMLECIQHCCRPWVMPHTVTQYGVHAFIKIVCPRIEWPQGRKLEIVVGKHCLRHKLIFPDLEKTVFVMWENNSPALAPGNSISVFPS